MTKRQSLLTLSCAFFGCATLSDSLATPTAANPETLRFGGCKIGRTIPQRRRLFLSAMQARSQKQLRADSARRASIATDWLLGLRG